MRGEFIAESQKL